MKKIIKFYSIVLKVKGKFLKAKIYNKVIFKFGKKILE